MSLINDALKRAQGNRPPPPPPLPVAPLTPAVHSANPAVATDRKRWLLRLVVCGVLLLAAAAALVFNSLRKSDAKAAVTPHPTENPDLVARALTRNTAPPPAVAPAPALTPSPELTSDPAPAPAPAPAEKTDSARVVPKSTAPDARPGTVDKGTLPAAGPATNLVVAAIPEAPAFRLQGVVYHPTRGSAIINGRTLFIGDRISDYRLTRITPKTAELAGPQGSVKLSLDE
jgi:hypothetical protein